MINYYGIIGAFGLSGNIFLSKIIGTLYIAIKGLLFSVPSILDVVNMGSNIGYLFSSSNMHGIILLILEAILLIFTLTSSLFVTKLEIRAISGLLSGKSREKLTKKIRVPFKDMILSLTFCIILIIIIGIFEMIML